MITCKTLFISMQSVGVFRCLVANKITVTPIHATLVIRQGFRAWRKRHIRVCEILGLRVCDRNRRAHPDQAVKFGTKIFVHPDTAMGAGIVFHPTCMKTVSSLKFTPVWHGGSFELPTSWLLAEVGLPCFAAIGSIAVGVCTIPGHLAGDGKAALGGWLGGLAYRNWHC